MTNSKGQLTLISHVLLNPLFLDSLFASQNQAVHPNALFCAFLWRPTTRPESKGDGVLRKEESRHCPIRAYKGWSVCLRLFVMVLLQSRKDKSGHRLSILNLLPHSTPPPFPRSYVVSGLGLARCTPPIRPWRSKLKKMRAANPRDILSYKRPPFILFFLFFVHHRNKPPSLNNNPTQLLQQPPSISFHSQIITQLPLLFILTLNQQRCFSLRPLSWPLPWPASPPCPLTPTSL